MGRHLSNTEAHDIASCVVADFPSNIVLVQIRRKSVFKVLDALRRAILEENEQKSTCTKVQ